MSIWLVAVIVIAVLVIVLLLVGLLMTLPDIRRYRRLRTM